MYIFQSLFKQGLIFSMFYKNILAEKMVSCIGRCSKFFKNFDFFQSSKLLRYNGDAQYKTATGGITSLLVVAIFITLFSSMGLKTIRKEIVFSTKTTQSQIEPQQLTVTLGPGGKTMFAVIVRDFNLSGVSKLFDVVVEQQFYQNSYFLNSTPIIMEQCTDAHFHFASNIWNLGQKLPLSMGLCPQIGQNFSVQGKFTSQLSSFLVVRIRRCNTTTDPHCVSDAVFAGIEDSVGRFILEVPFVNVNINEESQKHKKYYLENSNIVYFNTKLGAMAFGQFAEDTILTDVSLMPYKQIEEEKVARVAEKFTVNQYLTNSSFDAVRLFFGKHNVKTQYQRHFNKIDTYFSYVGGLVGTIIGLILIMEFYTEKAYEISIARKVMLDKNNEQISSQSFSIFYYILMFFKSILNRCKYEPDWPKTNLYADCTEQIEMQLDVPFLLKKIMFLDVAVSKVLDKHQIQALYLRKKPNIEQLKEQRRKYFIVDILRKEEEQNKQKDIEEQNSRKGKQSNFSSHMNQKFVNPGEINTIPVEFDESSHYEDGSAISLSRKSGDLEYFEEIIKKIAQQGRSGKSRSKGIMEQLDPSTIRGIMSRSSRDVRVQRVSCEKKEEISRFAKDKKVLVGGMEVISFQD